MPPSTSGSTILTRSPAATTAPCAPPMRPGSGPRWVGPARTAVRSAAFRPPSPSDPSVQGSPPTPKRAGLGLAAAGLLTGFVLGSIGAAIAAAADGYNQSSHAPYPLAITACNLIGLWAGLVASVVVYSRLRASGHLGPDVGFSFHWPTWLT